MVVNVSNQKQYQLTTVFPDERFFESYWAVGDHAIDLPPFRMTLTETDISTSKPVIVRTFGLGSGQFTFEELNYSSGGIISGHFNATIFSKK